MQVRSTYIVSFQMPSKPVVSNKAALQSDQNLTSMLLLMSFAAGLTGGDKAEPLTRLPPSSARTPTARLPPRQSSALGQAAGSAGTGNDVLWTRHGSVESSLQQVRASLQNRC